MRRLPIYFVVDVSESMIGQPLEQVEEGIETIVRELRKDPYALETVYLSVIIFAGKAKQLVPLSELMDFYPPRLSVGGGTSMGAALNCLMQEINSHIVKTTLETKGDWKPIIFLLTDGAPTDNSRPIIEKWVKEFRTQTSMVCISLGNRADAELLGKLTPHVLSFEDTGKEAYTAFFKWVTASIKSSSMSINTSNNEELILEKTDSQHLSRIDLTKKMPSINVDEHFAIFLGKCQKNAKSYLVKYVKPTPEIQNRLSHLIPEDRLMSGYLIEGAYLINAENYRELSTPDYAPNMISSNRLLGSPGCPSCGNEYGFNVCACGGVICCGDEEVATCPWCLHEIMFSTSGSGETFGIGRSQG